MTVELYLLIGLGAVVMGLVITSLKREDMTLARLATGAVYLVFMVALWPVVVAVVLAGLLRPAPKD